MAEEQLEALPALTCHRARPSTRSSSHHNDKLLGTRKGTDFTECPSPRGRDIPSRLLPVSELGLVTRQPTPHTTSVLGRLELQGLAQCSVLGQVKRQHTSEFFKITFIALIESYVIPHGFTV